MRHDFTLYTPDGATLGTIKKKVATLGHQEYWVEKDGQEFMRIYGDFTNHQYQMETANQTVAAVHRKWVSLRDQLGVSITGNVDHRVVIGTAIIIEHIELTRSNHPLDPEP